MFKGIQVFDNYSKDHSELVKNNFDLMCKPWSYISIALLPSLCLWGVLQGNVFRPVAGLRLNMA